MISIRFSKVVRNLSKQSRPLFLTAAIQRRIARWPDFLEWSLSKRRVSFSRRVYALRSKGGSLKQPIEEGVLFRRQVLAPLSQGPQHPFQSGVFFFREGPLSAFSSVLRSS